MRQATERVEPLSGLPVRSFNFPVRLLLLSPLLQALLVVAVARWFLANGRNFENTAAYWPYLIALTVAMLACFLVSNQLNSIANSSRATKYVWLLLGCSLLWVFCQVEVASVARSDNVLIVTLLLSLMGFTLLVFAAFAAAQAMAARFRDCQTPPRMLTRLYRHSSRHTPWLLVACGLTIALSFGGPYLVGGPFYGLSLVFAPWGITGLLLWRFVSRGLMENWPILYFRAFSSESQLVAFRKIFAKPLSRVGVVCGLSHSAQPPAVVNRQVSEDARARVFLASDGAWRAWVTSLLPGAYLVLIDLTMATENVEWERCRALEAQPRSRVLLLKEASGETEIPSVEQGLFHYDLQRLDESKRAFQRWLEQQVRVIDHEQSSLDGGPHPAARFGAAGGE